MTFAEILARFGEPRKPIPGGGFSVRCPAHDDTNPSLSVSPGNGSGPLFHCHAGCNNDDVLAAANLTWQDILPPKDMPMTRRPAPALPPKGGGKTTRYEIRDQEGTLVAIHGREDYAVGPKRIWWELPDGTPGLGGKGLADIPLYKVESLVVDTTDAPSIVCEGEKAAQALIDNGILAVGTATGSSGTPGDDALRPLLDGPVILWPDNDDVGRTHMKRIGEALLRLGHGNVRMIDWKNAPPKGDAADLVCLEGWRDEYDSLVDGAVEIKPPPEKRRLFEDLKTLLAKPRPVKWLVHRRIETPSTAMTYGASGVGKTFVVDDLTAAIATGGEWMGRKVSAGSVFYISGEGNVGLLRRFQAWQVNRGIEIPAGRIFMSNTRIEISEAGAAAVVQEVQDRAKEIGTSPALVVIDTLNRAMPTGADENSAKDIGAFFNIVDRIRDEFDCVVMVVHHTGQANKDRARGSSAIKAVLDTEIFVSEETRGGTRIVEFKKMKDLPEEPRPQKFTLVPVTLGLDDEDGEPITSCVVKWEGRTARKKIVKPTPTEELGLSTLKIALKGRVEASLEEWRKEFYTLHTGDNKRSKKDTFNRVRVGLTAKGLVKVRDDVYSLPFEPVGRTYDDIVNGPE